MLTECSEERTADIEAALAFTKAYREHERDDPALREAHCLRAQFPAVLRPLRPGDLLAGRLTEAPLVGFELMYSVGYECHTGRIRASLADATLPERDRQALAQALDFWSGRTTREVAGARACEIAPAGVYPNGESPSDRPERMGEVQYRWATINVDFTRLLRLGIPGLRSEVVARRDGADTRAEALCDGMLMALDLLADVCAHYSRQAASQAVAAVDPARREELLTLSQVLDRIREAAPATMHEAIQLVWLYALVAAVRNLGRMDLYLGDFYAGDLDAGRLTEAEALRLLRSWWRLMAQSFPTWSNRVMLGGVGRPSPESGDRFTLLALEATRLERALLPQTSLRVSAQTPPAVWNKALDTIAEGGVFPILYGDETNVPGIASSFHVSLREAEQYVASDCGEFSLDHRSIGSPNGTLVIAKVLEVTLFNGVDPVSRQAMGLQTGDFTRFESFDQLWAAFAQQLEHSMAALSDMQMVLYPLLAQTTPHLLWSLLHDDCLERGRGLFDGGACYRGILTETYGNITVADSLLALKQMVFEERQLTPAQVLAALAADFEGWEWQRQLLLSAPKFGNDNAEADAMAREVHHLICEAAARQAQRLGLDFALADLINASGHVTTGTWVGATPDGRRAGAPLTNGNNPSTGSDRQGLTALINSLCRLDTRQIGGQSCYLKFGPRLLTDDRLTTDALLKTFFAQGGSNCMITVTSNEELREALVHPERHRSLIVRVGGFSARFVELSRDLQEAILARTVC